jgi:hypothetical protein
MSNNGSQRTQLEQVSGWRLWLTLALAMVNLGALAAMICLPLVPDSSMMRTFLLILSAMNCVFVFAVHATSLSPILKVILSLAHVVFCGLAISNFHFVSGFQFGQTEECLYLVPAVQTLIITIGGFAFRYWNRGQQPVQFHFTTSDLMILLFGITILFPMILSLYRSNLVAFISSQDAAYFLQSAKFASLNCAVITLLASFVVWPKFKARVWTIVRLLFVWNLVVAIAIRFISHNDLLLDMVVTMTAWSLVCLLPLLAAPLPQPQSITMPPDQMPQF